VDEQVPDRDGRQRGSTVALAGGSRARRGNARSSRASLPASTRVRTATAVIALETLAMRKRDPGGPGRAGSTSPKP
jgi:hypothetical protein